MSLETTNTQTTQTTAVQAHPGDDFDTYINGAWKKSNKIPGDQTRWGSFMLLREDNLERLRVICEEDKGQLGELFKLFMHEQTSKSTVVQELVNDIRSRVHDWESYLCMAAELFTYNIPTLLHMCKSEDDKDPDNYVPRIYQSGLGLPDMSFYTDREDVHEDYLKYVKFVCNEFGVDVNTDTFMQFEKDMAAHHLTRTQSRDSDATYNKMNYLELRNLLPAFFDNLSLPAMQDVIVNNPGLLKFQAEYLQTVAVETLQAHLVFAVVSKYASLGTDDLVQANFEFYGKKLSGQEILRPRWKRVVDRISGLVGDELGKLYVQLHFPEDKQKMCSDMVSDLVSVLSDTISEQTWMSNETKEEALLKLGKLGTSKVGVPTKYHSIEGLWTDGVPTDPVLAVRQWAYWDWTHEECRLFYTPVDKELWHMTPQTVNAYYSPTMSEIVFPAGILQPPFFGDSVEENLGAIGCVIGHEMTHGFDDEGRKYNADGELKEWWTKADAAEFDKRTKVVEEHYAGMTVVGECVNGKLTLGENIADIGGVKVALRALKKHYGESLTREHYEKFFTAFARVWCMLIRDEFQKMLLKVDPHSPSVCRVNGTLAHIPEFYETYGVESHHKLYLPPEQRLQIW